MTVDATLFCNGATPEQKYHAVVADTAHGVHVSCLVFKGPTCLWRLHQGAVGLRGPSLPGDRVVRQCRGSC